MRHILLCLAAFLTASASAQTPTPFPTPNPTPAPQTATLIFNGISMDCRPALFGGPIPHQTQPLNVSLVQAAPEQLCDATTTANLFAGGGGSIALVKRGACFFSQKVHFAEAAGAAAVVVTNNVAGAVPIMSAGSAHVVTIPVCMVSKANGAKLWGAPPPVNNVVLLSTDEITLLVPTGPGAIWYPGKSVVLAWHSTVSLEHDRVRVVLRHGRLSLGEHEYEDLVIGASEASSSAMVWTVPETVSPSDWYRVHVSIVGKPVMAVSGDFIKIIAGPKNTSCPAGWDRIRKVDGDGAGAGGRRLKHQGTPQCPGNQAKVCPDGSIPSKRFPPCARGRPQCPKGPTSAPTPHPCEDGTHGCDSQGNGGICYKARKTPSWGKPSPAPAPSWKCDCARGYECIANCDAHVGHTCAEKPQTVGVKWSGSCSFETSVKDCGYTQVLSVADWNKPGGGKDGSGSGTNSDDFDWTRKSGGTTSLGTGPSKAHDGSFYIYIEGSGGKKPGDTATLESPYLAENSTYVSFYYHMYGNGVGKLAVLGTNASTGDFRELWSREGKQHSDDTDAWTRAVVDLRGSRWLRFTATRGVSYSGDVAIDDVRVSTDMGGPTPAPTLMHSDCPTGWVQVGAVGADIGGCGLDPCGNRYGERTIVGCAEWCSAHAKCKSFTFGGKGSDKNHADKIVCTRYDSATANQMWTGSDGTHQQVMCARPSAPTQYPTPSPASVPTAPDPDGWKVCANEWGTCVCAGGTVRYGDAATGKWAPLQRVASSVKCRNSVFTDPTPGIVKKCYCTTKASVTLNPTPSPTTRPTASPTCAVSTLVPLIISTPAGTPTPTGTCSFEDASGNLCGWFDRSGTCTTESGDKDVGGCDDFNWKRHKANTVSAGTGPSGAHEGQYYLFIETSAPQTRGDIAVLESPALPATARSLSFFYHMYGSSVDQLAVFGKMREQATVSGNNAGWVRLWHKAGQQHLSSTAKWSRAVLSLDGISTVRFVAYRGSAWTGDVAIDDVVVSASQVPVSYNTTSVAQCAAWANSKAPPTGTTTDDVAFLWYNGGWEGGTDVCTLVASSDSSSWRDAVAANADAACGSASASPSGIGTKYSGLGATQSDDQVMCRRSAGPVVPTPAPTPPPDLVVVMEPSTEVAVNPSDGTVAVRFLYSGSAQELGDVTVFLRHYKCLPVRTDMDTSLVHSCSTTSRTAAMAQAGAAAGARDVRLGKISPMTYAPTAVVPDMDGRVWPEPGSYAGATGYVGAAGLDVTSVDVESGSYYAVILEASVAGSQRRAVASGWVHISGVIERTAPDISLMPTQPVPAGPSPEQRALPVVCGQASVCASHDDCAAGFAYCRRPPESRITPGTGTGTGTGGGRRALLQVASTAVAPTVYLGQCAGICTCTATSSLDGRCPLPSPSAPACSSSSSSSSLEDIDASFSSRAAADFDVTWRYKGNIAAFRLLLLRGSLPGVVLGDLAPGQGVVLASSAICSALTRVCSTRVRLDAATLKRASPHWHPAHAGAPPSGATTARPQFTGPPTTPQKCADEDGTCSCPGGVVAYGAACGPGHHEKCGWVKKVLADSGAGSAIPCNNAAFGKDPASGWPKTCTCVAPPPGSIALSGYSCANGYGSRYNQGYRVMGKSKDGRNVYQGITDTDVYIFFDSACGEGAEEHAPRWILRSSGVAPRLDLDEDLIPPTTGCHNDLSWAGTEQELPLGRRDHAHKWCQTYSSGTITLVALPSGGTDTGTGTGMATTSIAAGIAAGRDYFVQVASAFDPSISDVNGEIFFPAYCADAADTASLGTQRYPSLSAAPSAAPSRGPSAGPTRRPSTPGAPPVTPTPAPSARPSASPSASPTPEPRVPRPGTEGATGSCSFETSLAACGYVDLQRKVDDDFDWTRQTGGTASLGTGPAGAQDGSYYLYIEVSGGKKKRGDTATIESPYLPEGATHLQFYFHMHGGAPGTLTVEGTEASQGGWTTLWSKEGAQHVDEFDNWTKAVVELKGAHWLRFTASRGASYSGDIAIDDIRIFIDGALTPPPSQPVCPPEWEQVGQVGSGVAGCGMDTCADRYAASTIVGCAESCSKDPNCAAFTYADKRVCSDPFDDGSMNKPSATFVSCQAEKAAGACAEATSDPGGAIAGKRQLLVGCARTCGVCAAETAKTLCTRATEATSDQFWKGHEQIMCKLKPGPPTPAPTVKRCADPYDEGTMGKPWSDFVSCAEEKRAGACQDGHVDTLLVGCARTCGSCETSNPDGWKVCATEWGTCACAGGTVRYGDVTTGRWAPLQKVDTTSGSVRCVNSIFGNPAPGDFKQCYCTTTPGVSLAPTPSPTTRPTVFTATPSASPTPAPTLHPCRDGSHDCEVPSRGGFCLENPLGSGAHGWICGCVNGYDCASAGCRMCTAAASKEPTKEPTRTPTRRPTREPTRQPTWPPPTPWPSLSPTTTNNEQGTEGGGGIKDDLDDHVVQGQVKRSPSEDAAPGSKEGSLGLAAVGGIAGTLLCVGLAYMKRKKPWRRPGAPGPQVILPTNPAHARNQQYGHGNNNNNLVIPMGGSADPLGVGVPLPTAQLVGMSARPPSIVVRDPNVAPYGMDLGMGMGVGVGVGVGVPPVKQLQYHNSHHNSPHPHGGAGAAAAAAAGAGSAEFGVRTTHPHHHGFAVAGFSAPASASPPVAAVVSYHHSSAAGAAAKHGGGGGGGGGSVLKQPSMRQGAVFMHGGGGNNSTAGGQARVLHVGAVGAYDAGAGGGAGAGVPIGIPMRQPQPQQLQASKAKTPKKRRLTRARFTNLGDDAVSDEDEFAIPLPSARIGSDDDDDENDGVASWSLHSGGKSQTVLGAGKKGATQNSTRKNNSTAVGAMKKKVSVPSLNLGRRGRRDEFDQSLDHRRSATATHTRSKQRDSFAHSLGGSSSGGSASATAATARAHRRTSVPRAALRSFGSSDDDDEMFIPPPSARVDDDGNFQNASQNFLQRGKKTKRKKKKKPGKLARKGSKEAKVKVSGRSRKTTGGASLLANQGKADPFAFLDETG